MEDFLTFKKMLSPIIIQIVYWLATIASILWGIALVIAGDFKGYLLIFLGPIIARICCELLIVVFSINDRLQDIQNILKSKSE